MLERAAENSHLILKGDEDPIQQVLGCSVSYRIVIGSQQASIVLTLQTILAGKRMIGLPRWRKWYGLVCTPVLRQRPRKGQSTNALVATSLV